MNRRTLRRLFAVAVAVAAITPLFALESHGCAHGAEKKFVSQQQGFQIHELQRH